ncbi:MAG: hypothetical protein HY978_02680 [Candidatus Liptonbacteria bacterium]|nr:hypothetical protein [Candidatus Liptonbacteria bacterium]
MSEHRTCQNCKSQFTIEPEDFDFYRKIGLSRPAPEQSTVRGSLPNHVGFGTKPRTQGGAWAEPYSPQANSGSWAPTWCPECRTQRRMSWRNMWHLFKKADALTGQEIFSAFPPESPVKIYDRDYWWTDAWNPIEYGREIDWAKPFIQQVHELILAVPLPAHSIYNTSNCQYCTNANGIKNCYLTRGATDTEDCAYVIWDHASKQCLDSHMTERCELGYNNVNATRCYKAFSCINCEDCQETILCKDCNGCSSCLGCVGLRGKSYYLFNQPYSKEDYARAIKELGLDSWAGWEKCAARAREAWLSFPVKFIQGLQNARVSGDYIYNSKNTHASWRVHGAEDCKFCFNLLSGPVKDCYDYSNWGQGSELLYECLVCGDQTYNLKFCWNCLGGAKNIQYSIFCPGASNVFGCVGIRKTEYCILNKQYSKEEYEKLVPKLIEFMNTRPYVDKGGRTYKYGEFFPAELSPFPYNVSEAYEWYPKSREEVLAEGWAWKEAEKRSYQPTLKAENLPGRISEAEKDMTNKVIECAHAGRSCNQECTEAFRIIPQEFEFLKRFDLPLPRLCPNCRHYERLKHRNLPKLWHRRCACRGNLSSPDDDKILSSSDISKYRNTAKHFHDGKPCPNEFETSYPPERPEIVYCEQCYNSEVA